MSDDNPDDDRTVIRPAAKPPAMNTSRPATPVADQGNALPVGTMLGEFELTRVVGEGGFGIVYLAQDHSLGRRVALKEYMPSALAARTGASQVSVRSERHRETFEAGMRSFVNEAKLLAQFDHPSLVKVYRFWEANGTAYMVMPYYEGATLKDKLREMGGPPDEAWMMALLRPLTEALAVLHAEHCYHRDVAPDNVMMLAPTGRPLLLDFGAARRVINDMTQALTVILKPGYAPVEQYAEVPGMKQGPWTDVYALAAVVYFAITGKTPPPSVGRLMHDNYVPLTEAGAGRYSQRFLAAVDRALKVKPDERTPSIDAFRADLGLDAHVPDAQETRPANFGDSVLPAASAAAPPPASRSAPASAPAAAAAGASRTGLWLGVGGAALVAVGAGAFFLLTPGSKPVPPAAPPPVVAPAAPEAAAPAASPQPPAGSAVAQAPEPAPAPPPAAAPAAPAAFSLLGEFDRILKAQTAGFVVEAVAAKQVLKIGQDRLSFTISSSRGGYVYVLLNDPDGSLYQFFPNKAGKNNQIKPGQKLTLPQSSWPLDVSDPPGPEHFLVIVSEHPRDFSHLSGTWVTHFLKLPDGERAAAAAAAHAGPGSVFAGIPKCDAAGCDVYGATQFTLEVVR
jgi:serine/threonine protein kinase